MPYSLRLPFVRFCMLAALVPALAGNAADVTEIFSYGSSVTDGPGGPLDLKAELNYHSAAAGAPIAVVMHAYSGATGHFDRYRVNAQRLRDAGFFVISPAMRGREGSEGVRDSGGLEIHDIYDAVESVIADPAYAARVDASRVYITGYSGGGGNVMSAVTKFPDYFAAASAFFGMSDYGYDPVDGWYFNGADGRTSQLNADIGNPTTGDPDVIDRYHARASNLASRNNPYTEIRLFVNVDETICPPVNSLSFRDNAVAAAAFPGEFDSIIVHLGQQGLYHDFNGDGIDDPDEEQYWPHQRPTANQQAAAERWFLDRVLSGELGQPTLNDADELFVAGFVRTRRFALWLGDGQNAAAELRYDLSDTEMTFELNIASLNDAITGQLTIDTSVMAGQPVDVLLNDVQVDSFTGGGDVVIDGLQHGDRLTLRVIPEPATLTLLVLAFLAARRTRRTRSPVY